MRRSVLVLTIVGMLVGVLAAPASARGNRNPHGQPVVFVTSQGLYYDSIVLTPIPFRAGARYQELFMNGGLSTEFGPGDVGYLGGRWWVDVNDNDEMDPEVDMFFICPLLGPGRLAP